MYSPKETVDEAVQAAKNALPAWKSMTGFERGKLMKETARLVRVRLKMRMKSPVINLWHTGKSGID